MFCKGEVNPVCGCFASLGMTGDVIPSVARTPVWMLHCAHASLSMTGDVIPNAVRNPVWMLRYAQHDRLGMANLTLLSLSFERRGTFRHRRNRVR